MEKLNHCFLYICFMVWQMVYLSVCLTLFLCSCSYCILCIYNTKYAGTLVHLQIDVLYLFKKYLFNISEYKAMLIKLLIYHTNIDICVYVCVYMCVCVYINKKKYR